ncbi:PIN domain-containing protein [Melampsora americana]|nr:PIN domain-containing protein [Melampsora americana]
MTSKRKRAIEACVPENGQNPFRKRKIGKSDGAHFDVHSGPNASGSRHANFHSMPSSTAGTGTLLPLSFPPEAARLTEDCIHEPSFGPFQQGFSARVAVPLPETGHKPWNFGSANIPNSQPLEARRPTKRLTKPSKTPQKLRSQGGKSAKPDRLTKGVISSALNRLAASQSPGLEIDENRRRDEVKNSRQSDHTIAAEHQLREEPAPRSDPALEPSEEGPVFSAQHHPGPQNAHHENLSYGKQYETEKRWKKGPGLKLQIILDTNVVIGHLDFLRRLLSSSHEDTELLVPKAVLTELDAFKGQHRAIDIYIGRKSIKQDMWCAARDATNWLLQATQAYKRVILQQMDDEPKQIRRSKDGDARILAYAIKVARRARAQAKRVALFSNDNILRLKAKSEGILAYCINDIGDDPHRLLSMLAAPRVKRFDSITNPQRVPHIEKGVLGVNIGNSQSSHLLTLPEQSGSGTCQSVVTKPPPNVRLEPLGNQIATDEEVIVVTPHANSGQTCLHNTEDRLSANQLGKRKDNNAPYLHSPRTSDSTDTPLISEDLDVLNRLLPKSTLPTQNQSCFPDDVIDSATSEKSSLNWLTREIPSAELDAFIGQPAAALSPSFVPDIDSAKQALNNILENLSQFFKKHPYQDPAEQYARAELTKSVIEHGRVVMNAVTPPAHKSVVQNPSSLTRL